MRIILATRNAAKVTALAERVGAGIAIEPLPSESGRVLAPAEREDSFEEIAQSKAIWYSSRVNLPVAASDGGLLIPALGHAWNPLETARFAGPGAGSLDRALAVLDRCGDLAGAGRAIGWTECLALARDGTVIETWTAHSPPGMLATDVPADIDPKAGFWVPWIWRCPEYGGRRLCELTERERLDRRDHWAVLGDLITAWAEAGRRGRS